MFRAAMSVASFVFSVVSWVEVFDAGVAGREVAQSVQCVPSGDKHARGGGLVVRSAFISMGAGSSVSLKKARESEEFAEKVFKDFDTNGDGTLSVIELYDAAVKYGEAIDGEWSLDRIKEALDRFDANGDKKLDLQEFKMALSQLEDKKRSKFKKAGAAVLDKAGTKGNTKLKKALKRSFTWKKDVAAVADAAMDAAEEAEEVAEAALIAAAAGTVDDPELTPEQRLEKQREAFWTRQDGYTCWQVPFALNRSKMPWLKDGETGLAVAMKRCREMGKTPLLVDTSYEQVVINWLDGLGEAVLTLDAHQMFLDERAATRSHKDVMRDSRLMLIKAMREGLTLHIRMNNKVTEFTGGLYCDEESFPLSVFDQRVIDDLLKSFSTSTPIPPGLDKATWLGLWQKKEVHPFAKILREPDLTIDGGFFAAPGFNVVVTTTFKVDEYMSMLRNALPINRLQGINPLPSPV